MLTDEDIVRARPDQCARCGYPRHEHSYNGACYGLCGEFTTDDDEARAWTHAD